MKMFNAKRGVRLLHGLHDEIVARVDIEPGYGDVGVGVAKYWAYAAMPLLTTMDSDDLTDMMAVIANTSDKSVALDLFTDGFTYWLGIKLTQIHAGRE